MSGINDNTLGIRDIVFITVGISATAYGEVGEYLSKKLMERGFVVKIKNDSMSFPGMPGGHDVSPKFEFTEHYIPSRHITTPDDTPTGPFTISRERTVRPPVDRAMPPFTHLVRISVIGRPNVGKSLLMRLMSSYVVSGRLTQQMPTLQEIGEFPSVYDLKELEAMIPSIRDRVEIYMLTYPLHRSEPFDNLGFKEMLNEQ